MAGYDTATIDCARRSGAAWSVGAFCPQCDKQAGNESEVAQPVFTLSDPAIRWTMYRTVTQPFVGGCCDAPRAVYRIGDATVVLSVEVNTAPGGADATPETLSKALSQPAPEPISIDDGRSYTFT